MSDTAQDNSDELSSLGGFFFYVFFIHPLTAWILRPGRFERKRSIMYAITFLVAVASIKSGAELLQKGPNHYQKLGVTRSSTPLEIKRAYKRKSLEFHPDKNPSPDASDQFDAIKQSYDVLMDMDLRDVYNKFGKEGIASKKIFSEEKFLLEVGIFYLTWGMLAFLLTLGKKNGEARNWTFTGLIVMLVVEVLLITSQENPLPAWLFPTWTEYEVVWLLHSLFPAFMNGCRSLGAFLYVDLDMQTRQLLLALQEQGKDILLVLRDVQIGVQSMQSTGVSAAPQSSSSTNSARVVTGNATLGGPISRATPTGKLKELQERLQTSNSNVAQAVKQLKTESNKSSSMGFYLMILGYVVISYIFS